MGGFRLAVGRVSLVHTLCYCQHRARGRRARLDAGGQRMPCKFSSPSHPVLLSAQGPGGAEHVEVQEAGGGAPHVAWVCCTPLSWSWTAELSPPHLWTPQVTTDPSAKIAANACGVAWICCTPLSWSWTAELSPPNLCLPQVTTEPSAKIAANAQSVARICCTPLSWSWTAELSPPYSAPPQVTSVLSPWHHKAKALFDAASCGWSTRTVRHSPSFICASSKVCSRLTKTRFSPVIILRCFCPKARWAAILKTRTEEDGKSDRSS